MCQTVRADGGYFRFVGGRNRCRVWRRMDVRYGFTRTAFDDAKKLDSYFLFELFHAREEFSQAPDPGNLLLHLVDWPGGIAEPYTAGNVFGYATLRRDDTAVSNFHVAHDSYLASHGDAFS